MSHKNKDQGELSEQQLDRVSDGTEVRKMSTIVVEAKRQPEQQKIVKMDTIMVNARREKHDAGGTQVAGVTGSKSKN